MKPENSDFPFQIELFSRNPDIIVLDEDAHLTPIPVDDDLSNLSAILLNDDYYGYMIKQSVLENGLHLANKEALICLKAKAYLEIAERIVNGSKEDEKQLRKHKADVFRLAVMLVPDETFKLPESIQEHLITFAKAIAADLPDKAIFKEMGLGSIKFTWFFQPECKIYYYTYYDKIRGNECAFIGYQTNTRGLHGIHYNGTRHRYFFGTRNNEIRSEINMLMPPQVELIPSNLKDAMLDSVNRKINKRVRNVKPK